MTLPRLVLAAGAALALVACDRFMQSRKSDVIALEGATLIDGSGGRPVEDALILIRGGHIETVARVGEVAVPKGATTIALVGKTIIPGLIDAHARVERWTAPRFLAWGVTTVRDFAGPADTAMAVRSDLNTGAVLGPRVFTTAGGIDGPPTVVPDADVVSTGDAARQAVDRRSVAGTDWIAMLPRVTPEMLPALIDEARTFRFPIAAQPGRIDALTAARAGATSLELLSGIVTSASRDAAVIRRAHGEALAGVRAEAYAWARLDSATVARLAKQLATAQVAIVPGLVTHDLLARLDDAALAARPEMNDVPDEAGGVRDLAGYRRGLGWLPADGLIIGKAKDRQRQFLREFRRAGGLLGAGSGAAAPGLVPGRALHDELALLVAAGLTPLDAIATATRRNAQLLRADSLGWLAPGRVADLVVLNGRPDEAIAATTDIHLVMTRGRIVRPDSLRAAWQQ